MANNMTNWDVEAQNIEQRRRYADALRSQSMEPIDPGQLPGVPISPFQGLAKVFKSYTAGQTDRKAAEDSQNLTTRRNQALADALKAAFEPVPGQPEQRGPFQEGLVKPAVPERQRTTQEISRALLGNPDTMNVGANLMVQDATSRNQLSNAMQTELYKRKLKSEFPMPTDAPSNVQEWEYFNKLGPKDQERYLRMKRTDKFLDIGSGFVSPSPTDPTKTSPVATRELSPGERPDVRGQQAAAAAEGKDKGERKSSLVEMEANLPRLEVVVKQLSGLGQKATYTKAGQARDVAQRELGLEPREAAVARKEYIAKVDNEVLPLLRQTFGAQFTEKEGQSLKATLGDPNASPAEKDAVLRSFIDSKRAQVDTQRRKVDLNAGAPNAGATSSGTVQWGNLK